MRTLVMQSFCPFTFIPALPPPLSSSPIPSSVFDHAITDTDFTFVWAMGQTPSLSLTSAAAATNAAVGAATSAAKAAAASDASAADASAATQRIDDAMLDNAPAVTAQMQQAMQAFYRCVCGVGWGGGRGEGGPLGGDEGTVDVRVVPAGLGMAVLSWAWLPVWGACIVLCVDDPSPREVPPMAPVLRPLLCRLSPPKPHSRLFSVGPSLACPFLSRLPPSLPLAPLQSG